MDQESCSEILYIASVGKSRDWESRDWESRDWESRDWESRDWESRDWESRDWESLHNLIAVLDVRKN